MPMDAPRLYLITPPMSDAADAASLVEAIAASGVACMLLRIAVSGDSAKDEIFCALARPLQDQGIACLVEADSEWARRVNADGVHIEGTGPELQAALRTLHPGHIVGAGGLETRDEAMIAGEAGADYVMFGGPASPAPHAQLVERVSWWSEIFNLPCVGYAQALSSIGDLVRAGADFIALGEAIFTDPRGAAAALHDAARLIASTRETIQ